MIAPVGTALDRTALVRTVLGDVDPALLGVTNYHEHLFQVSPLLAGDELEDEGRSGEEAATLVAADTTAMIEATPTGLGARPDAVARISAACGLHIVHTTGAHHSGHYATDHPLRELTVEELAALFTADVHDGLRLPDGTVARAPGDEPVRAGVVKGAARYWSIDAFGRRVLTACAQTSLETGVAVMVHLDHGSAAHEVLDLLAAEGLAADRVVLAHVDRNPDPGLHASLAERGAYLGYDGAARHREVPDSVLLACLEATVATIGADRVLLGGDVARASRYRSYGGIPGLDYLPRRFFPRVAEALGPEVLRMIAVTNPARLLPLTATV